MSILPIQYRTKFKKTAFKYFDSVEILDYIQEYLDDCGYNYIKRYDDKIVFHKADGWSYLSFKTFLVSGVVRIKEGDEYYTIINGNWLVFLIAVPFLILSLISQSRYSTFDQGDIQIIWYFFLVVFIANLIARIFAHLSFKNKIDDFIRNNYAQQNT